MFMSIVVTGSVFVDIKGYPIGDFIPTGRNAGNIEYVHGGVARNIVEDIANTGLNPVFVGIADDTGAGEDVIEKLKKSGVNTDYMRKTQDGMGTWLAVFDQHGEVCASISKRPDLMPILDILDEDGDEIFSAADSILLELDIEEEILDKLMYFADKYGKPVYSAVTNMTIAMERLEYLKKIDMFVCNQGEAAILFGDDLMDKNPSELESLLASKIRETGLKSLIVTMAEQGAVYVEKDGTSGVVPAEDVKVIDTTGAGDSFFAGACAALSCGRTIEEACRTGTVLAASVIQSKDNVCPKFSAEELGLQL